MQVSYNFNESVTKTCLTKWQEIVRHMQVPSSGFVLNITIEVGNLFQICGMKKPRGFFFGCLREKFDMNLVGAFGGLVLFNLYGKWEVVFFVCFKPSPITVTRLKMKLPFGWSFSCLCSFLKQYLN